MRGLKPERRSYFVGCAQQRHLSNQLVKPGVWTSFRVEETRSAAMSSSSAIFGDQATVVTHYKRADNPKKH